MEELMPFLFEEILMFENGGFNVARTERPYRAVH
jgi:hypothetical protein